MATLRQYFDMDFNKTTSIYNTLKCSSDHEEVDVIGRIHLDFDANAMYISCYIPICTDLLSFCVGLIEDITWATAMATRTTIQSGFIGEEPVNSSDLQLSKRIFIYSETELSANDLNLLKEKSKQIGRIIQFRGQKFALERSRFEKPMAFVSHDSRDKDTVARPLATKLMQMVCPVWYDEFSLTLGDSLRQSIETGLKECKKCILILSPNFLSNTGWTKTEFNAIFTREIIERSNLVLPIWHNVSQHEVYEFSPSLADRKALDWSLGLDEVSRQIYRTIIS